MGKPGRRPLISSAGSPLAVPVARLASHAAIRHLSGARPGFSSYQEAQMVRTARSQRVQSDSSIQPGHPTWGLCPECRRDRRVNRYEEMIDHNRWDVTYQKMTLCAGSGSTPGKFTGWKRQTERKRA